VNVCIVAGEYCFIAFAEIEKNAAMMTAIECGRGCSNRGTERFCDA
jgi:hypothetical protein